MKLGSEGGTERSDVRAANGVEACIQDAESAELHCGAVRAVEVRHIVAVGE